MKKSILVIIGILVLMILAGCETDPEGLAPPKSSSTVGQASYTSAPLTLDQLNNGVSLDSNWNMFIWTDELTENVPIRDALNSISSSYYYIYSYNEQKYYFNPNERYATYNSHSHYSTRLISELKPSHKYGVYMARADNLQYTTSVPTCDDGIRNGDEEGIDCGGNCPPCETGETLWVQSGDNIYYNNGNVGIGTDNPQTKLEVNGKSTFNGDAIFHSDVTIDSDDFSIKDMEANYILIEDELEFGQDSYISLFGNLNVGSARKRADHHQWQPAILFEHIETNDPSRYQNVRFYGDVIFDYNDVTFNSDAVFNSDVTINSDDFEVQDMEAKAIFVQQELEVERNASVYLRNLEDGEIGYACIDANGKLFKSLNPCR